MALTLRLIKGSPLTHQELDDNFRHLTGSIVALEAATGSYVYSGSFDGSSTLTLYSGDTNYSIDLSALSGGGGSTDISALNTFTGSIQIEVDSLTAATSSYLTADDTGSFVYSGSYNSSTNTITLYSIDQDYSLDLSDLAGGSTDISALNTFTGSIQTEVNSLTAATSSYLTAVDTGSFYISSSVNLNTITFTQGDGTTESVTVDTGSGVAGTLQTVTDNGNTTTNDVEISGSLDVTGSFSMVGQSTFTSLNNLSSPVVIEPGVGSPYGSLYMKTYSTAGTIAEFVQTAISINSSYTLGSLKFSKQTSTWGLIKAQATNTNQKSVISLTANGTSTPHIEIDGENDEITINNTVLAPDLANTTTPNIVGYDTASGELTYYGTGSFGGGSSTDITALNAHTGSINTYTGSLVTLLQDKEFAFWNATTEQFDGNQVRIRFANGGYKPGINIGNTTNANNNGVTLYETSNVGGEPDDHILISDGSGSNLIIRNAGDDTGNGYIYFRVDEPGASGEVVTVARFGGDEKSAYLYHSGSNVFRTEFIDEEASIIVSGSISGSKDVFFSGLPNTTTPNIVGYDTASGQLSYYGTGSFGGGSSTDISALNTFTGSIQTEVDNLTNATSSYLYSGSYDSGTNEILLYSADQNYSLDLSGLAGGGGSGLALTASDEGSELSENVRSLDFVGNGVVATNSGNAVTVTVTQVDTGSFYYSSSVELNTVTFHQGDGTTESVTVDTGSSVDISALNLHTGSINTFTGSIQTEVDNLTAATSSYLTGDDTGSFLYSGSYDSGTNTVRLYSIDTNYDLDLSDLAGGSTDITALNLHTGSINTFTGSIQIEVDSLTAATSSYLTGDDTGSFYYSSSVNLNTITFTQGDGTTESVTVETGSDTNLANADQNLTTTRTVTANGSSLTFDFDNANLIMNSDTSQQVQINNLTPDTTAQVVGYAGGVLKAMNTSSFKPRGPVNTFQFNNNNEFSGSSLFFDRVNAFVGIGESSPDFPLHITDTTSIGIKLERTDEPIVGIQFYGNGATGGGAVIRGLANDFEVIQRDSVTSINERNLFISQSGEVYAPRLNQASTQNLLTYNTSDGEVTYLRNSINNITAPTGSVQYATSAQSATTSSFVSVAGTIRTNTGENTHASPVIPQLNGKTLGTDAFITATWADPTEAGAPEQFCVLNSISGSGQLLVDTGTVGTGRSDAIIFQGVVLV